MNAEQWAERLTGAVKYKRDHTFRFTGHGMLTMTIDAFVRCSRSKIEKPVTYTAVLYHPEQFTDAEVLRWVRNAVRRFELHEVDEWLSFEGELLNDPHKPGVDPDPNPEEPSE